MQLTERVVRHHRVHVVFEVVVHVHVDKAQHAVHVDGAAVTAVVEHIFGQAHVLAESKQVAEPRAIEAGQAHQHQRQPAVQVQRGADDQGVEPDPDTRISVHLGPLGFGDEVLLLGTHSPERMAGYAAEGLPGQGQVEQAEGHHP